MYGFKLECGLFKMGNHVLVTGYIAYSLVLRNVNIHQNHIRGTLCALS
jgi:hypothetical protein